MGRNFSLKLNLPLNFSGKEKATRNLEPAFNGGTHQWVAKIFEYLLVLKLIVTSFQNYDMRKVFFGLFLLILPGMFVASCSKTGGTDAADDITRDDENDITFPVINFSKPLANQVYTSGDSIIIEGKVTDEKSLYKGKVFLKNETSSQTVTEQFYETHFLKVIDFRVAYKAIVSASTEFSVIVEFEDHGYNKVSQSLKVKVKP